MLKFCIPGTRLNNVARESCCSQHWFRPGVCKIILLSPSMPAQVSQTHALLKQNQATKMQEERETSFGDLKPTPFLYSSSSSSSSSSFFIGHLFMEGLVHARHIVTLLFKTITKVGIIILILQMRLPSQRDSAICLWSCDMQYQN